MKTPRSEKSRRLLSGIALLAFGILVSGGSRAAESSPAQELRCRQGTAALELAEVSERDVRSLVESGVVPARLAGRLNFGEQGRQTLWWSRRRTASEGFVAQGFAADRYEERTLEVFGAAVPASALGQLIEAVATGKLPGTNAVMVSWSTVRGDLHLGAALPAATSLRLGFIDSDLGDVNLASSSVLGSGIRFERELSFQCVKARNLTLINATFDRQLTMTDVEVEDMHAIKATFSAGADFHSLHARSLDFSEARFGGDGGLRAREIRTETFDLAQTRMSRANLERLSVTKGLSLENAVVEGSLVVANSTLGASAKKGWIYDTDAPVTLQDASLGSFQLSEVTLPQGINLVNVHAGGIIIGLATTERPSHQRDPGNPCPPADARVSLRGAQVNGWLQIQGTDRLDVDLTDTRATYLDVRSGKSTKASAEGEIGGCLRVAGLNAPYQFWADPFPFPLNRLADMEWRGDLATFRAQLERNAGKSRADAWYRQARDANSAGTFDRWVRGDLLSYGTKSVPPLLLASVLALTLVVAFVSWCSDALEIPAQSFWTTRFGRPLAHLLFAVRTVTPFSVIDVKVRPGANWHGAPVELVAVAAKVLGLALLGGLLVAWTGYI